MKEIEMTYVERGATANKDYTGPERRASKSGSEHYGVDRRCSEMKVEHEEKIKSLEENIAQLTKNTLSMFASFPFCDKHSPSLDTRRIECLVCLVSEMATALAWYGDEAQAIKQNTRFLEKFEGVEALIEDLALDGGRKATKLLEKLKDDKLI